MKKLDLPSPPMDGDLSDSPPHAANVTHIGKSDHVVQFYETDEFLAEQVSAFVAEGLEADAGAIVIAAPNHLQAIENLLSERGIDLPAAKANQQFFSLDAEKTLSQFMIEGAPNGKLFQEVIGGLILKLSRNGQRKVRAFGEMVALLWAEGKGEAALRLEQLWNQLSHQHSFSLFCAYPMQGFSGAPNAEAFLHICQAHSHVLPTENSIQSGETDDERLRSMAALEQKARSFETEFARNKESDTRSRLLAAIVESSDDAIISKDLNGIIMSWNAAAERIFGYTAEEIVGKSVLTLIPPDRQQEEPGILARLRSGLRIDHYETVRRRKDGSDVQVSLTVSPLRDGTGKIVGASKIARDITERKHAEMQQQAVYELTSTVNRAASLPEIYDAAIDAICRCQYTHRAAILLQDSNGVMRFKAWRDLSDAYRQAVEGHSPWRSDEPTPQPVCIDDIDHASLDEHLRSVVRSEGIRSLAFLPIVYEGRLLGKFMIYYDIPHRFTPEELRLAQTIVIQVAFAIERRRSGENLERMVNERTASLREAIAQMEEFSYSVSHDLRAPVRAMQCYAEVLMEDYGRQLDESAKKYLDRIIRGGERMDRLIQDILVYSRLSRREIQLQPINLDKLTRDVVRQYQDMTSSTHADISVEGHLQEVVGHEASLSQAISNLLNNAVKFVVPGAKPKVRIRTEQRNGHVHLWVEDNGIGIKPEYQHRLFNVFERVHPEKNYEGTGIGLAIVRKSTERMGGKAGVESDGLNGSRFWIQLPAASHTQNS